MTPPLDLLLERLKQITHQLEALEVALARVSRKGKQSQPRNSKLSLLSRSTCDERKVANERTTPQGSLASDFVEE